MTRHLALLTLAFVLIFSLAFTPYVSAQDMSQKELIDLVKKQAAQLDKQAGMIEQLQEEVNQLKGVPEERVIEIVDTKVEEAASGWDDSLQTAVSMLSKIDIHGFLSQGFLWSTDNEYLYMDTENGSFQYNEAGINFMTNLSDDLRIGLQIMSRDMGITANNKIYLDWAFADYRWRDWLGVRVGRIKTPYGLYNETRDIDALRTNIILPQSLYREDLRDVLAAMNGIGIYGNIDLESAGSLSYQSLFGQISVDDSKDGALPILLESGGMVTRDITTDSTFSSNTQLIWNTPLDGLRIGGNVIFSQLTWDTFTSPNPVWGLFGIPAGTPVTIKYDESRSYIASIEYIWDNLTLAAEYVYSENDLGLGPFPASRTQSDGYYVSADYRFNDWFSSGIYYSIFYPDSQDRDGDQHIAAGNKDYKAWMKDLAISTRFDITDNWVAKLEGHYIDGTASLVKNDTMGNQDWFLIAAKLSYSF